MLLGATDKAHTPLWKKICAGAVSGKYKNKCREREREREREFVERSSGSGRDKMCLWKKKRGSEIQVEQKYT